MDPSGRTLNLVFLPSCRALQPIKITRRRLLEQRFDSRVARNAAVQVEAAIQPVAQGIVALQQGQRAGAGCPIKSAQCNVVGIVWSAAAEKRKLLQMSAQRRQGRANRWQI